MKYKHMIQKYREQIIQILSSEGVPADALSLQQRLSGRHVIAYGAGECCHWFVEIVMKIHGIRPVLILDQKLKVGDYFEGIPAMSPTEFVAGSIQMEDYLAVICVGKQEYHTEIVDCLRRLGFNDILFLKDFYEVHNPFNLPLALREEGFEFFARQKKEILSAFELFSDCESWQVFTGFLKTHAQRIPVSLPARPREEQYFPKDVNLSKGYDRFVCCGAYNGDSIKLLHTIHGKVDEIICFEPEPQIYNRLTEYLWKNKDRLAQRITAFPCAVYSKSKIVKFLSGHGLGSRIFAEGDTLVQAVSLDDAIPGYNPTFICMDVEGAEIEVLKGAEKIIRQSAPDLSICVYHSPEHLWKIPLYLHHLNTDYRFHLRNYTSFSIETVLYASAAEGLHD